MEPSPLHADDGEIPPPSRSCCFPLLLSAPLVTVPLSGVAHWALHCVVTSRGAVHTKTHLLKFLKRPPKDGINLLNKTKQISCQFVIAKIIKEPSGFNLDGLKIVFWLAV